MQKGKNINHPAKGSSIKAEPIKNIKDVKAIESSLSGNPRNLALFVTGISTSLRVVDLLNIQVKQVLDIEKTGVIEFIKKKNEKILRIRLTPACVEAIQGLIRFRREKNRGRLNPNDCLFTGRQGPLSLPALNNLIKKWCSDINLNGNFGSHTLRKTFGYHRLMHAGADLRKIMALFNHTTETQTLEYLCVEPNELEHIQIKTRSNTEASDESRAQRLVESEEKIAGLESTLAKLRESEEKYKTFFDNAYDQIAITDLNGIVLDVNKATWDIFGQDPREAIGKHVSELGIFNQKTLEAVYEKAQFTAMGNPPPRVELEAFRKDGSKVFIDVNSKLMEKDGKLAGFISIIRDVTDRKQMEAALQESKEMARALLNATSDSVMLLDSNGIILDLNASYAEKFKRSVEECVGLCLWTLLPPGMAEKRKMKLDQVFQSGKLARIEEEYNGKWFDNVVYPVLDGNKKVSSIAIFSHDITIRKQAEEALRSHRDQLERLVKERTASLEDTNTALKVLLKRRAVDKEELEERMLVNVKELVIPFVEELKNSGLNDRQKAFIDIIEANLNDVISPYAHSLSTKYYNLSPTEIRIAHIIKQGKSTKEIAELLKMSQRTIDNHRYNLRRKLGLNNKKANLATHLLSIK